MEGGKDNNVRPGYAVKRTTCPEMFLILPDKDSQVAIFLANPIINSLITGLSKANSPIFPSEDDLQRDIVAGHGLSQ